MFSRQPDAPKQSFLSCKGAASLVANHDSDIYTVSSGKAFPFLLEWSGTFQSDNISLFVRENKPGDEAEAEYKKKTKMQIKSKQIYPTKTNRHNHAFVQEFNSQTTIQKMLHFSFTYVLN